MLSEIAAPLPTYRMRLTLPTILNSTVMSMNLQQSSKDVTILYWKVFVNVIAPIELQSLSMLVLQLC